MKEGFLLSTKFVPRPTGRDVIWVHSFLRKMEQAERNPLMLVRAGAGYGKSIMLSAYFGRAGQSFYWLTLNEEDTELSVFLEDLIHAVRSRRSKAMADAGRVLVESEDLLRSWKYILNAFINGLYAMRDEMLYLVIEDCHAIQGQAEVERALEYLLRHSPPNLRVVLHLPLPLYLLPVSESRLKGRLLIDEEAAHVREVTEGWPIAVEMVAGAVEAGEPLNAAVADLRVRAGDLISAWRPMCWSGWGPTYVTSCSAARCCTA